MRHFKFAKLVRDKIPAGLEQNNVSIKGLRKLETEEYITELVKKLLEEASEMQSSAGKDLQSELADAYEVLEALKSALDISDNDLASLRKQKLDRNGGFVDRTYIHSVGLEEDNSWLDYYQKNPQKYPEI